jgi:acyl-CoA thioesterase-1
MTRTVRFPRCSRQFVYMPLYDRLRHARHCTPRRRARARISHAAARCVAKHIALSLVLCLTGGCGEGGGGGATTSNVAAQERPIETEASPVVLMGDSITESWEDYGLLGDHLPLAGGEAIDAGVTGNTTAQMLARFQNDVLAHNPSVVVILGGTNDIFRYFQNGEPITQRSLFAMVEGAQSAGTQVIVGTIPPSEANDLGYDTRPYVDAWNAAIVLGAKDYGYLVADYHSALINADGTQNQTLFESDRIHPNVAGFQAMWATLHAVPEYPHNN